MALSEDLDSLCTQQLFRAAESLQLDEFDCILSQTSDVELSALCTPGPSLSARTGTDPSRLLEPHPQYQLLSSTHQESSIAVSSNRFTAPTTDADVQAVQSSAVPKNTSKSTSWAVNIWKEWTAHRRTVCHPLDCPPHLLLCQPDELNQWLSKFVLEVRRKDGQLYPPQTLYSLCCGLLRYVREIKPDINFFKDAQFSGFQRTLDGLMKQLRSCGLGSKKRQAEPITINEEAILWEQGLLGSLSPQVLLDTMVFLCGMYFALRSGQEHRDLQFNQIELIEPPDDSPPYLVYTENISKNNTGIVLLIYFLVRVFSSIYCLYYLVLTQEVWHKGSCSRSR